ncbi:MAG: thiamine pyrophosphate-requiring protein [Pseudomonadota bacterium]
MTPTDSPLDTARGGRPHEAETVGEAWLRLLKRRGVDCLYANAGTDFPSIVEGLARSEQLGLEAPRAVICPQENAAVSMAHGHAAVTGRPQAVMVHVTVGTANALGGLINAERDNIPLLMCAGRTPVHEDGPSGARSLNIHWAQEMFDQASMVRETVRWDYELRAPAQLEIATDRALAIAQSAPRGPVYLTLPREVLADAPATPTLANKPLLEPAGTIGPDPAAIDRAARLLDQAARPLIVTARAGIDPSVPTRLARLAERLGAPVVEYRPRHLNLAGDHPLHGGFEVGPWLAQADCVFVIDCDVPWIPKLDARAPGQVVIQAGEDPLQRHYPIRGFPSDVTLAGSAGLVIDALHDAVADAPERRRAAMADAEQVRTRARDAADANPSRLTAATVSAAIDRVRAPDALLVNEYPLVRSVMTLTEGAGFLGSSPAGGLGWGLPAALGAKLARPEREVIACLGDGSYLFANPLACHQIAAAEGLGILIVIFDNARWGAVDRATRALYPDGFAARANRMPLTSLEPSPDYAAVARACGLDGATVTDAAELDGALNRALATVRGEGRSFVLSVRLAA